MLLYTDGLIETRGSDGRYFDLTSAAAALATGTLEDGVSDLMGKLNNHGKHRLTDDVAIMAFEPLLSVDERG